MSCSDHYESSFIALESPINRASGQALVLQILMEDLQADLDKGLPIDGSFVPKAISFMVDELAQGLRALEAQHLDLHNAAPDVARSA